MSTTPSSEFAPTIDRCQPADATPVSLEATALESTAPEYLRDLKREFATEGLVPADLSVEACFDDDCSLATQEEIDRIRSYVRAGAFLGVGSVSVTVADVTNPEKVRPALAACAERAEREGVVLDLETPVSLEN
uniref:DUF7961 domain-containing protein n=1 Tax=Natrialba swarupiae TaxID=2448032 RepID=A0A5D5AJM1_9EURY|nr:hypothetical protein [Natrialba swarupiae]TYT61153.1 hypothetical protein FYC77_15230 [Natrialba swarupiae]